MTDEQLIEQMEIASLGEAFARLAAATQLRQVGVINEPGDSSFLAARKEQAETEGYVCKVTPAWTELYRRPA